MPFDLDRLAQSLARLPLFDGEQVELAPAHFESDWCSFTVASTRHGILTLRLFFDTPGTRVLQRSSLRAAAEADGLRIFSILGLGPRSVWAGALDAAPGARASLTEWIREEPVGQRPLSGREIELYAGALRVVHGTSAEVRVESPLPRTLERWWLVTHEQYRELPPAFVRDLPQDFTEAITLLAQSVAADVQTHKRFWNVTPATLVQGSLLEQSLAFRREEPIFLDWQRFGPGDPAFEVAGAGLTLSRSSGHEAAHKFISDYLDGAEEPAFSARVEIYLRAMPFGRAMRLLSELAGSNLAEDEAVEISAELAYYLRLSLTTYRRAQNVDGVLADLGRWVGERQALGGKQA